jgi:hypothetical protein
MLSAPRRSTRRRRYKATAFVAGWIQCVVAGVPAYAAFDPDRAFRELIALTRLGPRPAGSDENREAQQLIAARFRQAGWPTVIHDFRVTDHPSGGIELGNVIARRPGTRGDLIVVMTHHDTARLERALPLGANDGASGPALLMELALQLRPIVTLSEIWLVSCDGSHPPGAGEARQLGYHGSRELLRTLGSEGRLSSIRAVLVVDRIADRNLRLTPEGRVDRHLQELMLDLADRFGISLLADPRPRLTRQMDVLKREADPQFRVPADHVPFFEAGIRPVVVIVDGERDGMVLRAATDRDDLSGVSAESLARVGNLVFDLVLAIDQQH